MEQVRQHKRSQLALFGASEEGERESTFFRYRSSVSALSFKISFTSRIHMRRTRRVHRT
jgi:hypothetical protein